MESDLSPTAGKLIVTCRAPFTARKTRAALRRAAFPARITRSGFRSIFVVEAEREAIELARQVYRACPQLVGHATAVLAEVDSKVDSIKEAAVKIGMERVGAKESFSFRLFKRGEHNLAEDTPKIEYDIGGAINTALENKIGEKPLVNLKDPDVTINAEVLGPITFLGILRKDWRIAAQTEALELTQPHAEVPEVPTRKPAGPLVSVELEAKHT
jgi:tRNA(Ser,Leu) C12 N-acetylase TAN1